MKIDGSYQLPIPKSPGTGTAQQVNQEEDSVIGRHEPYLNKIIGP